MRKATYEMLEWMLVHVSGLGLEGMHALKRARERFEERERQREAEAWRRTQ